MKDDKEILEISFIGMKKQTLQVDATRKKALEITLVDDVKTLDDLVYEQQQYRLSPHNQIPGDLKSTSERLPISHFLH